MVSFSNTDDAHCDSVNGQSTMPSETVQMNVKIPVQPSNFDALQMGALLGAPGFMKHGKNHTYQINNKTKSIPSPGTNIHKASLKSGAFSFLSYGRFLVVATRYLFAGFLAIFEDVRYF
ncbi:hypothetical protein [Kluyvera ascorbata]|uniref:hypothetical protein n=1 Tax=Kluyvera ascorbata TaxID=51288 RepID=UPI002DBC5D41|nr:hypothetical protein [Kluyvera ascorbata]MEB6388706.1 hypothetical protein [Kluyvera ascorbata]